MLLSYVFIFYYYYFFIYYIIFIDSNYVYIIFLYTNLPCFVKRPRAIVIDWALYNNYYYYDTLPMRAAVLREQGRRRRARPRLRWEDCVKT